MSKDKIIILCALLLLMFFGGGTLIFTIVWPKVHASRELDEIAQLYEQGDLHQSRTRMLSYVKEYPSNSLAWIILGNIQEDLDENQAAEKAYKTANELDPKAYQALTGLGVLCRKKKDYDGAVRYYDQALKINPAYAQAYSSIAIIELIRSNDQHALELAEKAYKLDEKDPVIAANLAVAYHYNNRLADRDRMYAVSRKLGYTDAERLDRIFSGELTIRD